MNWKKILLFAVGAAVVGGLSPWLQAAQAGQHVAFTLRNVGVPAFAAVVAVLGGLFTRRPQDH